MGFYSLWWLLFLMMAVLAGGRRLAALALLAEDKSAKGFSAKMNVPCRIVPEGADISSLSFSENETQLPMTALDRFEAFAAMVWHLQKLLTGLALPSALLKKPCALAISILIFWMLTVRAKSHWMCYGPSIATLIPRCS